MIQSEVENRVTVAMNKSIGVFLIIFFFFLSDLFNVWLSRPPLCLKYHLSLCFPKSPVCPQCSQLKKTECKENGSPLDGRPWPVPRPSEWILSQGKLDHPAGFFFFLQTRYMTDHWDTIKNNTNLYIDIFYEVFIIKTQTGRRDTATESALCVFVLPCVPPHGSQRIKSHQRDTEHDIERPSLSCATWPVLPGATRYPLVTTTISFL